MSAKILSDRAIVGAYYQKMEEAPASWVGDLSFEFDSSQDTETHAWIGDTPAMREWVGGKNPKGFLDHQFAITNADYESTIDYHRRHLTEDKTGQFQARLAEHVNRIDQKWASLLSALIIAGESSVCYDGQYFFDTDHSEGDSGTISNDISVDISAVPVGTHGTTTAPSAGEFAYAVLKGIEQMYGFKDDQGEPINEMAKSFSVMVPTSYFTVAAAALTSKTIDQGDTNLVVNLDGYTIDLITNARLNASWTTKFGLFRKDAPVPPFIRQVREKPEIKVKGEGSDYYFDTNRKQVSIEMAGAVGYGRWQGSCLVTLV